MEWTELTIETSSEAVEAVSHFLMEAGASGVAIEDALDLQAYESDAYGELVDKENMLHIKEGAKVMAYFPETVFLPEIVPTLQHHVNQLPSFGLDKGAGKISLNDVVEDDWATAWKKYYHPVHVSRFLTIVPEWEKYEAQHADERIIVMDPGMAFGTGTHPTTFLTLHALEMTLRGGETVLDVGTGSGVLSIAAKHFGAKNVYAYDLDEVAVRVAQENLDLNPIAADVQVAANDLLNGITQTADIIVANILPHIIEKMIPDAWNLVNDGGKFIVSGIITEKESAIHDKMQEVGFKLYQKFQQEDWLALIYEKPLITEEA
ncbi:50S ribosomal protein L11 methyltransferase [Vagococcus lutrae]|uniref:50S ribosomal protein L11 methyltransferase n=1 Tax=Vagococcus lutrae TaxID=81947 RepID=UPI00200C2E41|nr:50S ribosomal protein L11 methyltransferase [Vagococcus lutrae]UQF71756.1 50S ribosomal protein L11 methyltransferase [Vagococcus lutrae]